MPKISLTNIYTYPVKSTFRIQLNESEVGFSGLKYDRSFAVLNSSNKIVTARENKNLLKIKTKIVKDKLIFSADEYEEIEFSLVNKNTAEQKEVTIFKDLVHANLIDHKINSWISTILGESSQLIKIDEQKLRKMKLKYNAKENDIIGFKDASPIHLITESSVEELNKHLENPVNIHHFRSNIVLKGTKAYEEDHWNRVRIGACEFDVAIKAARCPMITIDPETSVVDKNNEPLRTLAGLRREKNKANFGIYLIPRKIGIIQIDDEIIID